MPRLLSHLGFALVLIGILGPPLLERFMPSLHVPSAFQPVLLALGLMSALFTCKLPSQLGLLPLLAALHFGLAYVWRGQHPQAMASDALIVACAFAFLLGLSRITVPRLWVMLTLMLAVASALIDLFALWPVHAVHDAVGSVFENRHAFAGFMLVGLFVVALYFEKSLQRQPSVHLPFGMLVCGLAVLFALLLSDSRSAQGTLFLLVLPLLFLSVRLDFKEPHPERLLWVAGSTLAAGLIWLNLPDRQLHAAAHVFTESPVRALQQREAALQAFTRAPWFGHGTGSYPWAARALLPELISGKNPAQENPTRGAHSETLIDPLWHQLEPGFDQAITQADLALDPSGLPKADSHPLQILAENGLIGFALECLCLGLALLGLFREALRFGTPSARYLGMALLALALHGLFTPALESPVMRLIYFGLIGYGASYLKGRDLAEVWRTPFAAYALRAAAFACWAATAWGMAKTWHAERLFHQTLEQAEDPRAFTDGLVQTLRVNPNHVEAIYAYAQVLVRFGRKDQALESIDRLSRFAPDPPRQDLARASIHWLAGSTQEATRLLTPWLHRRHSPLPALEMTAEIYAATQQCEPLQRLQADSIRLRQLFPQPLAELYTVSRLQEDFLRGEEVNFLQLWFGGRSLRKRFAEKRLADYHRTLELNQRLEAVLRSTCLTDDDESGLPQTTPSERRRPRLFRQFKG